MNSTVVHPAAVSVTSPPPEHSRRLVAWLPVLALVCGWLLVFNQLRVDWTVNPQYAYGWFVPVLAVSLFWRRWQARPAPKFGGRGVGVITLSSMVLLALWLPIRLIQEANPEWRLVLWAHALQMALLSLCVLGYMGGWSWVRTFAFPIAFLFVAVPWTKQFEDTLVQNLMRAVAGCTVEVFHWFDIPASQQGNLIEVRTGVVGVDEACSGVRSVQTTVLITLFLGDLYQFAVLRRLALLGLGLGVALVLNLGRTLFLVWIATRHGVAGTNEWHDTAALTAVGLLLPLLWLAAMALRPKAEAGKTIQPVGASVPRSVPALAALAALGWGLLSEGAAEGWYRWHERGVVANARWSVDWQAVPGAREIKIGETALSILRCTESKAVTWHDSRNIVWKLFFLRWAPGRNSAQLASAHTPDICLPGSGYKLISRSDIHLVDVHGLSLPVRHFIFERQGVDTHVFYCLWTDRLSARSDTASADGGATSRLRAVWAGERHLGQQVLEVAISGPSTSEEAFATLKDQLRAIVRLDSVTQ